MRKRICMVMLLFLIALPVFGCARDGNNQPPDSSKQPQSDAQHGFAYSTTVNPTSQQTMLTDHLSVIRFEGNDFFETFLESGGAITDSDVVAYLAEMLGTSGLSFGGNPFGCSTIAVESPKEERIFGRNFDWNACDALIVVSEPENGFASICTVNTDFIQGISFSALPDEAKALIAVYAPLDGMNEKGLVVSVNMIADGSTISQNTEKTDITTTTAIRLLLNQAATVEEAIELLQEYDFHASMDFMVHLAIADVEGNSVVVEYINNEISIVKTPIVTNFYLTEGEKYGIGTQQSHTRYEILQDRLEQGTMTMDDVRDALASVSKGNFHEFESTEWSIVFNQTTKEVHYYHREDYENRYTFTLK